eukprot:TRINITY_DN58328_c0_g1_i1.p1 TRINITY_DN58328_c0_g1~~TRINITY_DN58328_c0_g1_i1.p1  ORF type:complete len:588 (+),score=62.22 TRINITY_DN58328_c0_g1_i1:157-1920(+)
MADDSEDASINHVFALLKAKVRGDALLSALGLPNADVSVDVIATGPMNLLELLLASLQTVGPRAFMQDTTHLIPAGSTVPSVTSIRQPANARKRVAIFAGNFDPVTCSHLTCAAEIIHSRSADEVWLVPCKRIWRKEKTSLQSPVDRYCMCAIAISTTFSSSFPVRVSRRECIGEANYTYDLLRLFRDLHPGNEFCFVIGSDRLLGEEGVAKWRSKNPDWKPGDPEDQRTVLSGQQMLKEFDFLVIKRPGYDLPPTPDDPTGLQQFGSRLKWLVMPEGTTFMNANLGSEEIKARSNISSHARDSASAKSMLPIDGLVCRGVYSYIWRQRLYMPPCIDSNKPAVRKRVAVYGGAFDPPTNSHLLCAAEIVHSGCADEVWLVPCGPRPDKPGLTTSPLDRYVMCQIGVQTMFSTDFPVKVSDIECFSDCAFPTYDLLCSLRDKHPDCNFCFVIGSDWLQPGSSMADWTSTNWDWKPGDPEHERVIVTGHKMLEEFDFLVIKRPGYEVTSTEEDPTGLKKFGARLSWMSMQKGHTFVEGNLSSTEIRKRAAIAARVRNGASSDNWQGIDGLVPLGVKSYIQRCKLYNMNL